MMVPPSFQQSANRVAENNRNCYFLVESVDVNHGHVIDEPCTEGGTFQVNVFILRSIQLVETLKALYTHTSCSFRHHIGFSGRIQPRCDYCANTALTLQSLSSRAYSFVQRSDRERRGENECVQTSKQLQKGFHPWLSRLKVRNYTAEFYYCNSSKSRLGQLCIISGI